MAEPKVKREFLAYAIVDDDGTISSFKSTDGGKVFKVKPAGPSGGGKIYKHEITIQGRIDAGGGDYSTREYQLIYLSSSNTPLQSNENLPESFINNSIFITGSIYDIGAIHVVVDFHFGYSDDDIGNGYFIKEVYVHRNSPYETDYFFDYGTIVLSDTVTEWV